MNIRYRDISPEAVTNFKGVGRTPLTFELLIIIIIITYNRPTYEGLIPFVLALSKQYEFLTHFSIN
jgi:hypothetical protein